MKMCSIRVPRSAPPPAKMLVVALVGVLALAGAHPGSSAAAPGASGAQRGSVVLSGSPGVPVANPRTEHRVRADPVREELLFHAGRRASHGRDQRCSLQRERCLRLPGARHDPRREESLGGGPRLRHRHDLRRQRRGQRVGRERRALQCHRHERLHPSDRDDHNRRIPCRGRDRSRDSNPVYGESEWLRVRDQHRSVQCDHHERVAGDASDRIMDRGDPGAVDVDDATDTVYAANVGASATGDTALRDRWGPVQRQRRPRVRPTLHPRSPSGTTPTGTLSTKRRTPCMSRTSTTGRCRSSTARAATRRQHRLQAPTDDRAHRGWSRVRRGRRRAHTSPC